MEAHDFEGTSRFELEERLGRGGMGVVYRARDRDRNVRVALKLLSSVAPQRISGFKHEFRALADVTHPNLVTLYELFSDRDDWFFTMELVEGIDFVTFVRDGPAAARAGEVGPLTSPTAPAGPQRADRTPSAETTMPTGVVAADESPTLQDRPTQTDPGPHESQRRVAARRDMPPLQQPEQFERLRGALLQLSEGIYALHAAGHLHRDLKPSNVLVTRDGRVVILDFGIVTELAQPKPLERAVLVGTPAYMAPEQASGGKLTEAIDAYAIGVMMYETLTGRRPFEGELQEMLDAKQSVDPIPVKILAPNVPQDLIALCGDLLSRDPQRRPIGGALVERLGGQARRAQAFSPVRRRRRSAEVLVGRARELGALRAAFDATRTGEHRTVFVSGRSGVGKTGLVQHFASELPGDAVVLAGRCYEQESVPYKAVDSLIDELTRHLLSLPGDEVAALIPGNVQALAKLFPVLRQVEAVVEAPKHALDGAQPHELRRRGFTALRRLLTRLAERAPLVLHMDDAQWADADSVALLGEVLRPPDPPPLLLIASYRSEDAEDSEFLDAMNELFAGEGGVVRVDLDRLLPDEARRLAQLLLQRAEVSEARRGPIAEQIAKESGGNPFFIGELVQYATSGDREGLTGAISLDDVLRVRLSELPAPARRLLEVVAVAGRRVSQDIARRAAELGDEERTSLKTLRTGCLVRSIGARDADAIEVYHDRIRRAVVGLLERRALAEHHRRLAVALETHGDDDPEPLAVHFEGAGDRAKAGRLYSAAGDQARSALAFNRSVTLYQRALDCDASDDALQVKLADAYANAGRGREAAYAFLKAAEAPGTSTIDALEYRRRAAEELLHSGHFDEGEATLAAVCKDVGLRLAKSSRSALISLLGLRARLRLRGLRFRERDAAAIPPIELHRIDVCNATAQGLGMIDTFRAAESQTRGILLALDSGEPRRIGRALVNEVGFAAAAGPSGQRRIDRVLGVAHDVARRIDDDYLTATVMGIEGFAHYMCGRFRGARDCLEPAEPVLTRASKGVAFELNAGRLMGVWAFYYLGAWAEIAERVPLYLRDAEARGDLYTVTNMSIGHPAVHWLMRDDVGEVRRRREAVMQHWPDDRFHLQHYYDFTGRIATNLYKRDGGMAYEDVVDIWPKLRRSLLRRIYTVKVESWHLRAAAALAAAVDDGDRVALTAVAEADGRRLLGMKQAWPTALGHLVHAGVASVRGDQERAVRSLEAAEAAFEEADMAMHAVAALRRRGRILWGDEGRAMIERGGAAMREQGVESPERMTDMLAPGFE